MAQPVCVGEFDPNNISLHISVAAAIVLIVILQVYDYYSTQRCGLVLPFTIVTGNDENRNAVVVAFGLLASHFIELVATESITGLSFTIKIWYLAPFQGIITVSEVVLLYYPIFACIHSPHVILSSLVGATYTIWILVYTLLASFYISCPENVSPPFGLQFALVVPNIACSLALIGLFFNQLGVHFRRNQTRNTHEIVATEIQILYTKRVFQPIPRRNNKLLDLCWKNNQVFRYSTGILAVILIIFVCFYDILTAAIVLILRLLASIEQKKRLPFNLSRELAYDVIIAIVVACFISVIVHVGQVLHFMASHRKHMLDVYAHVSKSPLILSATMKAKSKIRYNLLFLGYFAAYMVLGFLIFTVFLIILCVFLTIIIIVIYYGGSYSVLLTVMLKYVYKFSVIPLVMLLVQRLMVAYLFNENEISESSIHIQNTDLYNITLFYMFFYNSLLGIVSCFILTLKVMALNLFFIGRVDRMTLNPKYYETYSHMCYLSFIQIEATYKHPMLRSFCQILLDAREHHLNEMFHLDEISTSADHVPKRSCVALNRWHLAVMLIRNPVLRKHRFQMVKKKNVDEQFGDHEKKDNEGFMA